MAYDPPELEIKDKTFGLVSPEAFELPTMSPLWTAVAYASFDTALTDKEKKKQVENLRREVKRFNWVNIISCLILSQLWLSV